MKKSVLALAFCAAASIAAHGESLRLCSYNVRCPGDKGENHWNNRCWAVCRLVKEISPDIVGFQEPQPKQRKHITDRTKEEFGGKDVVRFKTSRIERLAGNTFFVSNTPWKSSRSFGSKQARWAECALCRDKKTGQLVYFVSTHLDLNFGAQPRQMRVILGRLKAFMEAGVPVVLVGDHNCWESQECAKTAREVLKDSLYATETPPEGPWRTYCGYKFIEPDGEWLVEDALKATPEERTASDERQVHGGRRIDFLYVSPDVKVKSYKVWNNQKPGKPGHYPSDHFPVSIDVELPRDAGRLVKVWTGKGDGRKFSDAANWHDGTRPKGGETAVFCLVNDAEVECDLEGADMRAVISIGKGDVTLPEGASWGKTTKFRQPSCWVMD